MNIGVLFSGGKDSTFALHWATLQGWTTSCLLTMKSTQDDSWMFHTPNINLAQEQADALGLPLLMHETTGEKEKELEDMRALLLQAKQKYNIHGIVTGAVASEYQRMRINTVCHETGLKVFSPLWHKQPEEYLHAVLNSGYSFLITHVAAEGLTPELLGKKIDTDSIAWFLDHCKKHKIHPAGEGGEYESFVIDGPLFQEKLSIASAEKSWDGVRGTMTIHNLRREKKQ